jgi:uncharacterized repeat protein (TIGR01451 family)
MSNQRSSARRRLRFELLEGRDVPAILTGTETDPIDPPADDTTQPDIVITTVDGDPADLPAQTDVIDDLPVEPDIILTATDGDEESEQPLVDLATAVTVSKPKPSLGDVVTVTVQVTNNGMDAATGVAVNAVLPAGMTFESFTGPGTYDAETGAWAAGAVLPDEGAVLQIKAKVTETVSGAVTASITGADQPDPQFGNNTAEKPVTSVLAGLKLTKTVSSARPIIGSIVVHTVSVRNAGPGTARNIVVTDTLGDGLKFVRALPTARGTFAVGTKTWTIAALPAGMQANLMLVALVTKAGPVSSPATMTATGIDPTRSQLEATASLTAQKTLVPSKWTFHANPGSPMPTGGTPMPGRPAFATFPVVIPPGSPLALVWARFGLPAPKV